MNKLKSLERLETSIAKLPGIGKKSSERIAYAMLHMTDEDLKEFADAIIDLKKSIHQCPKCGILIEEDKCPICDNADRDQTTIMVVSYPKDVFLIENIGSYKGIYHVLNGELSINKGIGIDNLNFPSLENKIKNGQIKEIILATNPTLDGETTALYLSKLLKSYNIKTTRLAYGLQMGGNLDYTDQLTLLKALEGRRNI